MAVPEDRKPKSPAHAVAVLACGAVFIAAGLAAAYLLFGGPARLPGRLGGGPPAAAPPSLEGLPAPRAPLVRWRPWGPAALREAAGSDRLVLLHLAAGWSPWSALMERTTYADRGGARWIADHVVPVRLERDARPDLARRYGGAIPITALLLPTGEALASGALVAPDRLAGWGEGVLAAYRSNRRAVLAAREDAWRTAEARRERLLGRGRDKAWAALTPQARREAAESAVAAGLDAARASQLSTARFPWPQAHRLLREARERAGRPEAELAGALLASLLAGAARLEDPVWGGLWRASRCGDWSCPEHEKLLETQAGAIEDFAADAADAPRLALARRTADFVEARLRAGPLYANALAAWAEADGRVEDGVRFYAKDAAARRLGPRPAADPAAYAAPHAELAAAYLAAAAPLGRPGLARRGLDILEALWRTAGRSGRVGRRLDGPGGEAGLGEAGLLEDQLAFARACLSAYRSTRAEEHLARARAALGYAASALRDPATGALRVRAPGRAPAPGWTEPADPDGTAAWALLLGDLAALTASREDAAAAAAARDWALARDGAVEPVVLARVALQYLRP